MMVRPSACCFAGARIRLLPGLDELRANLHEVMQMLLEDGEPTLSTEFVGTQTLEVA